MNELNEILKLINGLSANDRQKLKSILSEKHLNSDETMESFLTEKRFSSGNKCPLCSSAHIKRNGHKGTAQRYLCMDCHKTFSVTTNTIVASTKKDFSTWSKYIGCMMEGLSIRKCAEKCGINRNTAFLWRHKILDALQNMAENVKLDGIIEGDETFFQVSYKGNHKNSKTFSMPRNSHKRGKSVHVRGLSHEKVCVPCAVNRNGLSIARISNLGRVSTKALDKIFDGRMEKGSTLCTDVMNSYRKFAEINELNLVQLKSGKAKKGIYHIQHINSYHSNLKKFMRKFNGVSTKYLNNYLIWNNILNYSKETWTEKKNIFTDFVFTTEKKVLCKNIRKRNSIPLLG